MQLAVEHSLAWTPSTESSEFSSAQLLPDTNLTCSLPQSHSVQEQQRPSKRSGLQPVCDARNVVKALCTAPVTRSSPAACHGARLQNLSSPSRPTPFAITQNLRIHDKRYLESSSPTVKSDAASDTMKGNLIHRPGDEVSDRATQCHHSHTAAVLQASASSPHVCKPTGSGQTSLGATVKRVGCGEALPPVCVEKAGMGNETYYKKAAVVGIKGDRLAVLHGAPQDNVVLPSDFDLDSDMEDDMGKLVNGDSDTKSHQTPPLSVLEAMDRQSRDADEYDPKLRRSPLVSQDEDSTSKNGQGDSDGQNCDILDYEVDWDEVMALIKPDACKIHEHNPSQPVLQYGSIQQPMATSTSLIKTSNNRADRISQPTTSVRGSTMLSGTGNNTGVRATSSISSVSNQAAALRVCFRIGEILNQGSRCFRNEQRAVFELFARVTYSSRETYARVQHFQFADFYKDYPPFLSGMMRNWEPDSILDSQAREFLGEGGPRFCRCTCRLQKSINTDTGWVISILSIRLSDQDEADSMRRATLT